MRRRGITLLELMISVVIVSVATAAATRAYLAGLGYEQRFVKSSESRSDRVYLEETMSRLLSGAQLTGIGYLVAPIPGSGSGAASSDGLGTGSSSIAFTTTSRGLSPRYLQESRADWQTLNQRFGPQGGATEVALSMTPAGDAADVQGLFLRQQTPPDDEPSRGGLERLLDERVRDVRFEFYDGSSWKDAWDSRDGDQKDKMPSVVRVSYLLRDERQPHSFLVRLPLSGAKGGGS